MSQESVELEAGYAGHRPAIPLRLFGWGLLAAMGGYLLTTIVALSQNWPGMRGGEWSMVVFAQYLLYAACFVAAFGYVLASRTRGLRADAAGITRFNTWLIRGCFWAVVFVGLVDMAISFMRVEGFLGVVFSEEMIKNIGRSHYRGLYIHVPLIALGFVVASFTRTLGFQWLALLIVIAELAIVFTRFVFSYEQAFMADLVRLWYAALFLFASAYTLVEEGHVRVDVLYQGMRNRTKGIVNTVGALLLGTTLCWTILIIGVKGKASIISGPVSNFEVSQSGFGMYTKYLMAAFLGVFAVSMFIQFVAQMFDSWADKRGEPGSRIESPDIAAASH